GFERRRYWVEGEEGVTAEATDEAADAVNAESLQQARRQRLLRMRYEIQWHPRPLPSPTPPTPTPAGQAPGCWLILADEQGTGAELAGLLRQRGEPCLLLRAGQASEPGQPQSGPEMVIEAGS